MATAPKMHIDAAKAALDAINALLTNPSSIKIRTGAAPTKCSDAATGTLLATLPMSATAFPASTNLTSDGLATGTANAITSDTNAANSGTAGYFRGETSVPKVIMQGTIGTSGCDLNLNTTTITAGDTVAITSFKDTLPCGDGAS